MINLKHKNIVEVYKFFPDGEFRTKRTTRTLFKTEMEYVAGHNLRYSKNRIEKIFKDDKNRKQAIFSRIIGQVAEGLAYLHERGICHRGRDEFSNE